MTKYCAHLHHTLAALTRYFPASLDAPLPNSEQINNPSPNLTYTKSTEKHIHRHYAPSVTLTHTTHIISSTAPTLSPQDLWTDHATVTALLARWTESLLVDHKQEDQAPTLASVMGVGRPQHQCRQNFCMVILPGGESGSDSGNDGCL